MTKITRYIPDAITCMNLISGCVAIYMAFHINEQFGALTGGMWAIIAIAAAAFFDFCDGASARMLKAYSAIGGDLDSLSDLVSFGVAPAMLIFNMMEAYGSPLLLCGATIMIPICGAIRLAKFNNDTEQTTYFRGMPIPANAIFWIGAYGWCLKYGYPGALALIIAIIPVSLAMVANFKMFSLKFKNFDLAENFCRYAIVLATIAFIALYGLSGLIWTILFYVLLSLMRQRRI